MRKAPSRRRGGKQAEARPSHAIRSSAIPNDAVSNLATLRSIPAIFGTWLGEELRGWIFSDIRYRLRALLPFPHDEVLRSGTAPGRFSGPRFPRLVRPPAVLYLLLPFGSQWAVLLGSDVRADEVSR